MKKKFAIVLLLLFVVIAVAGCQKEYTPDPAVREFLNTGLTAEKAYAKLATAKYTEVRTLLNKQGEQTGKLVTEVYLDKRDVNNLGLTIHNTYEGKAIESSNVIEMTSVLSKQDGEYVYTVTKVYNNLSQPEVTTEQMADSDASNLVVAIIYSDNGAYDEGLYFGDLFMLRIFRFPPESFYVDTVNNLCVFDEGMLIKDYGDVGDVTLHQLTKINVLGLLVYNYERYESVQSDYVMTCELAPEYEYLP